MNHLRPILYLISLTMLAACEKPVKTDLPPRPTVETSKTDPAPPQPKTAHPPAPKPEISPNPAPANPSPGKPILEVKETGDAITISGTLSSRFQASDIVDGLTRSFPNAKVIDQLKIDPTIPEVRWANRVNDLLLPLLFNATDARFYYEDGVTHLEGAVKTSAMISQAQQLAVSVMNDTDARDIKNRLKAESPEAPEKSKEAK